MYIICMVRKEAVATHCWPRCLSVQLQGKNDKGKTRNKSLAVHMYMAFWQLGVYGLQRTFLFSG